MKGLVLAGIGIASASVIAAGLGRTVARRGDAPLVAAAAPAAADPAVAVKPKRSAEPTPVALPIAPGEHLAYAVRWSQMEAATAEFAVAAGTGPDTIRIKVTAATTGLVRAIFDATYEFGALCDGRTILPLTVWRHAREGTSEKREQARFDRPRGEIETGRGKRPLDPAAHDPLTLLYALRAAKLGRIGSTSRFAVTDLGTPFGVEVKVVGRTAGRVDLLLTSREIGAPQAKPTEYRLQLEDGGARRVLELRTTLPVGEVVVALAP
jgi:hypothetical protein